jgi:3',5'-nucleoside bisphosphate phosphatase
LVSDQDPGIDLHIHSTASDGTYTPSEILAMAVNHGLKAIAITDHDTLAGSVAALMSGIPSAIEFITGVEISAAAPQGFRTNGSVHILGYGIDPANPTLGGLLERLKQARDSRNPQILERLRALGMDIGMAELEKIVGNAMAGRPHIARLMVQKKIAASIDDAFNRYLGKGKPAYVNKYRAPMDEAIAAINRAGGIAVLAHPGLNGMDDPTQFEAFLRVLTSMGLAGIEAFYPDHTARQTAAYCRLAETYGLLVTGGTDFHGEVTPGIRMGVGSGGLHVPYSLFKALSVYLDRSG